MKKLLLLLLFGASMNLFSASWIEIHENDSELPVYIDLKSITKSQGKVFYSSLENMASMGLNSVVIYSKADCKSKKITKLKVTFYGQTMGEGIPYEEENTIQEEIYPKKNAVEYKLMKFACTHVGF